MMRFKKLLGEINCFFKNFSKKAFTRGMVIVSAGMVTVLMLGTNGFIVNSKTVTIDFKEANQEEETVSNLDNINNDLGVTSEQIETNSNSLTVIEEVPQLIKEEEIETTLQTASQQIVEPKEVIIYTEKDYTALLDIVEAEATGEDLIGKILVANVVLNRVKSNNFPETIYDVIYEEIDGRAQFSPIDDGRMGSLTITESTYKAVEKALYGEDYSQGALFFVARAYSSENAVSWFDENLTKVTEHGVHEFYSY